MIIRSILTIAVLGSFVFGAAANADTTRSDTTTVTQTDGLTAPDLERDFASAGGLGTTR